MMRVATNYERQLAVAEALDALTARIIQRACQVHMYMEDMLGMSRTQKRDFYTLVVADVLGLDYYEVTSLERDSAKSTLFGFMYMRPSAKVTRFQDSIIIEGGSKLALCESCGHPIPVHQTPAEHAAICDAGP